MATKLYDVSVVTGTYLKDGEQKTRYENVGAVWQGSNGQYMVLKRTFNPAGVPFKEGSDSIFLNMFEPKEAQQQPSQPKPRPVPKQASSGNQQGQSRGLSDMDDDIPFLFNINTVCDTMGTSRQLLRAKYGKGLSIMLVNKGDF